MGHLLLTWRLVLRDMRRHRGEAVTFLLVVTAAAATLTLGLATTTAVSTAYANTRAAAAGPDITAVMTDPDASGPAARLMHAPGVATHAGPYFAFDTTIRAHGRSVHSAVEGRDVSPAPVDRPLVTSGTWLRPGGAVLERGFAQALGVRVGDRVTVSGRGMPVVGIAISASTSVYPWGDPAQGSGPENDGGMVWLTTADARAAAGDAPGVNLLYLKLSAPAATLRFIDSVSTPDVVGDAWVHYIAWQDTLHQDAKMIRFTQPVLVIGGWLLAAAAIVGLAALAAVRAARDNRRAGLLKAVGATPGTVAAVLLAQYLLLTVLATVLGLAIGTVLAPELAAPSAGLLTTITPPTSDTVFAVTFLSGMVALVSTLGPALRSARTSTVRALADAAHAPTHHPGLTAVTAHLPTSLLLGVWLLSRRPGRAALISLSTAATGLMVTTLLTFRDLPDTGDDFGPSTLVDVRVVVTGRVLLAVTLALVAMSALNTLVLGWSTAVQARRALTIARTLGATPGQVVTALCLTQLLSAVPGLVAGVPAGLVLFWLFSPTMVMPPAAWLLTAALVILLAIGALTALPAWAHTRSPAGRVLNTESV